MHAVGNEKCIGLEFFTLAAIISETVQAIGLQKTNRKSHLANRMVLSAGVYSYTEVPDV